MAASLIDKLAASRLGINGEITIQDIIQLIPIVQQFSGQFLCDPNEYNGWGPIGFVDNTNSQDLGNVGAAISRVAGGFSFPFDVRLKRFEAWHQNNNNDLQAWGWRIASQSKNANSNTVTFNDLLRECVGDGATAVAPRNYGNTTTQRTEIPFVNSDVIPAGDVVVLGVEAPTAVTTNRYVRVMSGFFEFERVFP